MSYSSLADEKKIESNIDAIASSKTPNLVGIGGNANINNDAYVIQIVSASGLVFPGSQIKMYNPIVHCSINSGSDNIDSPLGIKCENINNTNKLTTSLSESEISSIDLTAYPHVNNSNYFVGREPEFKEINNYFVNKNNQNSNILIIAGIKGIGKTELAAYYYYHAEKKYDSLLWFRGNDIAFLVSDYLSLTYIEKLSPLGEKRSKNDTILIVKNYLDNDKKNWLAIYDNANSYSELREFLPLKNGNIIITTSHKENGWNNIGKIIELNKFSVDESFLFFNKENSVIDDKENKVISILSEELEYYPLAFSQAKAYISNCKKTLAEYYDLYSCSKKRILEENNLTNSYDKSVYLAVKMSLDIIPEKLSIPILQMMSYLHSDNIPRPLLQRWLILAKLIDSNKLVDAEFLFDKVIKELSSYYIIRDAGNEIRIHGIIQKIIRLYYTNDKNDLFDKLEKLIEIIKSFKTFYKNDHLVLLSLIPHLNSIVEKIGFFLAEQMLSIKNINTLDRDEEICNSLITKAIEIVFDIHLVLFNGYDVDALSTLCSEEKDSVRMSILFFKKMPNIKILHHKVAENLKKLFIACQNWQSSARINLSIAGRHLTIQDRQLLEKVLSETYKTIEASDYYSKDIEMMISVLIHLGGMKKGIQKYNESIGYLLKAQELMGKDKKNDQMKVTICMDLGVSYRECGKYNESIRELLTALLILEKEKPNHPLSALIRIDLSLSYKKSGYISEKELSKNLYFKSLPIIKETIFKDLMKSNPDKSKIFDNYEDGINLYNKLDNEGFSNNRSIQRVTTSNYSRNDFSLYKKTLRQLLLKIYKTSPINFSSITGLYYPELPRLMSYNPLGLFASLNTTKDDIFSYIEKAGKLAFDSPRGMCYFWPYANKLAILITKPIDIKQVLIVYGSSATRKEPFSNFGKLFGENSIFLKEDTQHTKLHKLFFNKFSSINLDTANAVIQKTLDKLDNENEINLSNFFNNFAANYFVQNIFETSEISENFIIELSECLAESFKTIIEPKFLVKAKFFQALGRASTIDNARDLLKKLFIEYIIMPNKDKILKSDNLIKEIISELKNKIDISEDYCEKIYSNFFALFVAGHETVSITFQFIIKELARLENKEVLEKLKSELTKFRSPDDIKDLNYLRAIIKETLRLYPPALIIPKVTTEDIVLAGNILMPDDKIANHIKEILDPERNKDSDIKVPKGTLILISPYLTHRRPELWPNPKIFNPDRHISDLKISIKPDDAKFIPFSMGESKCVGWKFAERELMLMIANIYKYYNVNIKDNDFVLSWNSTLKLAKPTFTLFKKIPSLNNKDTTNSDIECSVSDSKKSESKKYSEDLSYQPNLFKNYTSIDNNNKDHKENNSNKLISELNNLQRNIS